MNHPLNALRHHVTGAIERGEKQPIVAQPPRGAYEIEITDTFGGEANYCWVKRGTTRASSRRGKIDAVKRLAGWAGWCRVKVCDYGDMMAVRPTQTSGVCQIAFVTWKDAA